jgi:hypothetical protein
MAVSTGYFSGPDNESSSLRWNQQLCPPGTFCSGGLQAPCPPGRFGSTGGIASPACSGPCVRGYYCTGGATSAQQTPCGAPLGSTVYCAEGSGAPTLALPGEMTVGASSTTRSAVVQCPSGLYCVDGAATPCPAGRFGCADRLSDPSCNGPCTPGFYCPAGSTSSQAYVPYVCVVCVCGQAGGVCGVCVQWQLCRVRCLLWWWKVMVVVSTHQGCISCLPALPWPARSTVLTPCPCMLAFPVEATPQAPTRRRTTAPRALAGPFVYLREASPQAALWTPPTGVPARASVRRASSVLGVWR